MITRIMYFELDADFLWLESDRWLRADFEVPRAENLFGQIHVGLKDTETFPEGLGQAAGEKDHETSRTDGWTYNQFWNQWGVVKIINKIDCSDIQIL